MKAIETKYNGCRFRSRLEARWAVFFDVLGVSYFYEHEGYDLDGSWYLPDFWLPEQECFIEVKGQSPTGEEERKARALSLASGSKPVFIFWGDIPSPIKGTQNDSAFVYEAWEPTPADEGGSFDNCQLWTECPSCHVVGIVFDGRAERLNHKEGCPVKDEHKLYCAFTPRLVRAYEAARSARFEHGEKG